MTRAGSNATPSPISITSRHEGHHYLNTDPGNIGLELDGNIDVSVDAGSIHVNSNMKIKGGAFKLNADEVTVSGEYKGKDLKVPLAEGASPIEDPLKGVPEPMIGSVSPSAPANGQTLSIRNGTHTLQPGHYPGGLSIKGGNITFQPGIYTFSGAGFEVKGNTNITAEEDMFYIAQGPLNLGGIGQNTATPIPKDNTDPFLEPYEVSYSFKSRSTCGGRSFEHQRSVS